MYALLMDGIRVCLHWSLGRNHRGTQGIDVRAAGDNVIFVYPECLHQIPVSGSVHTGGEATMCHIAEEMEQVI